MFDSLHRHLSGLFLVAQVFVVLVYHRSEFEDGTLVSQSLHILVCVGVDVLQAFDEFGIQLFYKGSHAEDNCLCILRIKIG